MMLRAWVCALVLLMMAACTPGPARILLLPERDHPQHSNPAVSTPFRFDLADGQSSVSYTHLTLPTNREV